MYQMLAELEAGSVTPEHKYPQEQIMFIVAGRMKVNLGGASHELLDTFSPPRDEYLALDKEKMRDA